MHTYLFIAAGGAVGSVLRYAVQGWMHRWTGTLFPVGTLTVNVAGCLAIGFLAAALGGPLPLRAEYRTGLTVGILGGFTTFSTFGFETFNLAADGQFRWAALNVVLSVGLGLAAVWAGVRCSQWWFGV